MRIIAGALKGRRLLVPRGTAVRPTSDRLRGTLFNMLRHGDYPAVEGARVADLFAGTGALGLEALSRGATEAVFVESAAQSLRALKHNIDALGLGARCRIVARDARNLPLADRIFDIAFLDPPYRSGLAPPALAALLEKRWLGLGSAVIVETAAEEALPVPARLFLEDQRRVGAARLRFFVVGGGHPSAMR